MMTSSTGLSSRRCGTGVSGAIHLLGSYSDPKARRVFIIFCVILDDNAHFKNGHFGKNHRNSL